MERGEEEAREGSGRDLREDSGDRQGISWFLPPKSWARLGDGLWQEPKVVTVPLLRQELFRAYSSWQYTFHFLAEQVIFICQ